MGCGSSSLKGDGPNAIGGDEPARPAKKINTNFASVDYDSGAKARRLTEYAPHETETARAKSTGGTEPESPKPPGEGENLEPYHTIDDPSKDAKDMSYPHENRAAGSSTTPQVNGDMDPTSDTAKDNFASANDPANPANQDSSLQPPGNDTQQTEKRGSWFGKKFKEYSDAKSGRNSQISEEDMQKYTGKSKEEIAEMVKEGKGVGRGQQANAVGPGSGWTAGGGDGAGGAGG
jgi:hypothetical protein